MIQEEIHSQSISLAFYTGIKDTAHIDWPFRQIWCDVGRVHQDILSIACRNVEALRGPFRTRKMLTSTCLGCLHVSLSLGCCAGCT